VLVATPSKRATSLVVRMGSSSLMLLCINYLVSRQYNGFEPMFLPFR
jgi:hypothetical protein